MIFYAYLSNMNQRFIHQKLILLILHLKVSCSLKKRQILLSDEEQYCKCKTSWSCFSCDMDNLNMEIRGVGFTKRAQISAITTHPR